MGFAFIACSLQDRRRSCITSGISTGFLLLLLIAGADCWPWGSDPWCPPGPEPKCPINPLTDQENYFPHPTDCHYYIQCDGSRRPICRPCSSATYFSASILNCVWPMDAACLHNDTTRQEILQPPICGPNRCNPAEKKEHNFDCTHYYICINGAYEERKCPAGKHFNKKTKECDDKCRADCIKCCEIGECKHKCEKSCETKKVECPCNCTITTPPIKQCPICKPCPPHPTINCPKIETCELIAHQTDCQLYYNKCSQEWSRCPGNLHFNKVTQSCDHQCKAGCKDPKDITECCTTEGDVFEDPCSCNLYYICRNGIKELAKCEDGLQYSSSLRRCDKSCSCDCAKLFARKPECCASTGGKPEPQCPDTTYPIFLPHPSNGQFFYTCHNGVRSCSRCPLERRWNIDTETCDDPTRYLLH